MKTQYIKKDNEGIIYYSDAEMTIRHREDGPACEYTTGAKFWFKNDELHRLDGPACEHSDGTRCYYKDGLLHREDGPALIGPNGSKQWYLNGVSYNEYAFNVQMKKTSSCEGKVVEIEGKKYKLVLV